MTDARSIDGGIDARLATHRLTIDLGALRANYRLLRERSAPARCAAVVKADAYGLGVEHVIPALRKEGCDTFFVAVPQEGVSVRKVAPDATVFILGGVFEEAMPTFLEANLVPVLSSLEQIEAWQRFQRERGIRLVCAIMVDTGMNRLGLSIDEARDFAARNRIDHGVTPILVMTHLACGDDPSHPLNLRQVESFQAVAPLFENADSSIANSAGVFLGTAFHGSLTRPGIALYGSNPVNGIANPMRPVVKAEARILQIRDAKAGETVSYGGTVTLARDTRIAIAGAGYADGFHRSMSGTGIPLRDAVPSGGEGAVNGRRVPVLGRVTMDMTMFDVTDLPDGSVREGDWIELFGPTIALDDAAAAAGTIGYEVLTALGRRATRLWTDANESRSA